MDFPSFNANDTLSHLGPNLEEYISQMSFLGSGRSFAPPKIAKASFYGSRAVFRACYRVVLARYVV
jgi:hypothetical protein